MYCGFSKTLTITFVTLQGKMSVLLIMEDAPMCALTWMLDTLVPAIVVMFSTVMEKPVLQMLIALSLKMAPPFVPAYLGLKIMREEYRTAQVGCFDVCT